MPPAAILVSRNGSRAGTVVIDPLVVSGFEPILSATDNSQISTMRFVYLAWNCGGMIWQERSQRNLIPRSCMSD